MQIEQVPARQWESWIESNDGVVLDVREPDEWALGTLPDAVLISLRDLPAGLDRLDPATPTLVVCRSGNRSQQAAAFMKMSGFETAANMAGGMQALGLQP